MAIVPAMALVMLVGTVAAQAQTPTADIHSAGPLSDIFVGNELSCQVGHTGNSSFEFFPPRGAPGDCGTFYSIDSGTLYGPDFNNHSGGSAADVGDTPFTPVSQTGVTGSGTAASPFQVTTVVQAVDPSLGPVDELTEVDSYVVGEDFYSTTVTLHNISDSPQSGMLFHAGDCFLRGFDTGFGALEPSSGLPVAAACSINPNDSPSSAVEQFIPITSGNHYVETGFSSVWSDVSAQTNLPDSCDCTTDEDNGMGINWDVVRLLSGSSTQFSYQTKIDDPGIAATGGQTFTGNAPAAVSGTVATINDSDTGTSSSDYTAAVNWGDGTAPDANATISGSNGSFTVADSHTYSQPGAFTITVAVSYRGNAANTATATDTALIRSVPAAVQTGPPTVRSSTGAAFSGSVTPEGLPTTAHFQYGLDSRYSQPGTSGPVYDHNTPNVLVGSDFVSHTVTASVSGLVPNATYHVRLVASNSNGTTFGPDVTFITKRDPAPGAPSLGKSFNVSATGLVLIKIHGVFVPLTELRQIPNGTIVNALKGTLTLTTAGGTQHATLSTDAQKKKKSKKVKTQTGKFGGAVFKVTQARSGLATVTLVSNAFKGAPSFASCKAKKGKAVTAALSKKTLQLLHSSAHGKFRSKGRYAAATVRGTIWTIADRCDGTLTRAIKDTVTVNDFVRHKTIILHAGHSYLALAKPPHKRR